MEMRPRRLTGGADAANSLACGDALAAMDADVGEVGVHRAHVASVTDDDEIAVAAAVPARPDDPAASCGVDACPVGGGKVEPRVKAAPAGPEAVAHGCVYGTQK
jgi:hypothetical protein